MTSYLGVACGILLAVQSWAQTGERETASGTAVLDSSNHAEPERFFAWGGGGLEMIRWDARVGYALGHLGGAGTGVWRSIVEEGGARRSGVQCILTMTSAPVAAKPALTVLVYRDSRVPIEEVSRALLSAQRIVLEAGVETDWRMATFGDPYPLSAISVYIHKGHSSERPKSGDVFGTAATEPDQPVFQIDIFYGSIEQAAIARLPVSELLAHVMVHEFAHLLLGREHTPNTLMAPHWGKAELDLIANGLLRLSKVQVKRLQAAVGARTNYQR